MARRHTATLTWLTRLTTLTTFGTSQYISNSLISLGFHIQIFQIPNVVFRMRHKRLVDDDTATESSSTGASKRQKKVKSNGRKPARKNALKNAYGQESALPGLDDFLFDDDGDIESDEEIRATRDALAYLQAVRVEAGVIPHVMTSHNHSVRSKSHINNHVVDEKIEGTHEKFDENDDESIDEYGWYEDGAYISFPDNEPELKEEEKEERELSPGNTYTKMLLFKYNTQKLKFKSIPSAVVNTQFRDSKSILKIMRNTDPDSKILCALTKTEILNILSSKKAILKMHKNISLRASIWIWGFLCLLGEKGTLSCDEVSIIREFGKQAVKVGISFFNKDTAQILGQEEEEEEEEDEEEEDQEVEEEKYDVEKDQIDEEDNSAITLKSNEEPLHQASVQIQTVTERNHRNSSSPEVEMFPQFQRKSEHADLNTRATLDSIVTIIGEVYGQRDLLEFRQVWGGEHGLWG